MRCSASLAAQTRPDSYIGERDPTDEIMPAELRGKSEAGGSAWWRLPPAEEHRERGLRLS